MVYEGNVKVLSDDGKTFTFDSPEAVNWLQMYVDMVKAGTVDNNIPTTNRRPRPALLLPVGPGAVLRNGLNLIRDVKANNSLLYGNLPVTPTPGRKFGNV